MIKIIDYSEKSIAIIGNTYELKDKLKSLNARFNRHLKIDGKFVWGWIASTKQKKQIEKVINDHLKTQQQV